MVVEAVQTYVNLVNGLSKATREKARAAAHALLAQAGLEDVANDAEKRVGKLTEEILGASRANRELLENLVAAEVTKAASRLGFVRSEELDEIREEIAELRAQLAPEKAAGSRPTGTATAPTRARTPAKKATPAAPDLPSPAAAPAPAAAAAAAKKAPAKKAPAKKAPATKAAGAGRASSTRPGAAQKRAAALADEGAAPVAPTPDPTADAGA